MSDQPRMLEVGEIAEQICEELSPVAWPVKWLSALLAQQLALREAAAREHALQTATEAYKLVCAQSGEQQARIASLEAQLAEWATWGVIEIAVRNHNVSSYMEHWEARALRAEAQLAEKDARREIEVGNVIDELRGTAQARDKALAQLSSLQALKEQAEQLCKWIRHTVPEWTPEVDKYLEATEAAIHAALSASRQQKAEKERKK